MLGHISGQDHINGHLSHGLSLFGTQTGQNITVGVLQELESYCQVMVLQHLLIVVHQSQVRAWKEQSLQNQHFNLVGGEKGQKI